LYLLTISGFGLKSFQHNASQFRRIEGTAPDILPLTPAKEVSCA
jgi:hypothetical protein